MGEFDSVVVPSRRGFIGMTLGWLALSRVPWIGAEQLVKDKTSKFDVFRDNYKDMTTAVRLDDGTLLRGPGFTFVNRYFNNADPRAEGMVSIEYAPIEIRIDRLVAKSGVLLDPDGVLISEMPFIQPQTLFNGDTLKVTHSICAPSGVFYERPVLASPRPPFTGERRRELFRGFRS